MPGPDEGDIGRRLAALTANSIAQLRDVEAKRRAERLKEDAVGRVASGVAHDLNNMLTIILGNAHNIRNAGVEPHVAAMVDLIERAAEKGVGLVQGLLSSARAQTLISRLTDVNDQIEQNLPLLQQAAGAGNSLQFWPATNLPLVSVDRERLDHALVNLVANARDAMSERGLVEVATSIVRQPNTDFVRIAVCDSGQGMSEDVRDKALEPFFSTKLPDKGTGLGLSIVHGFVAQSGGFIGIESAPGKGTTITLHFPVEKELSISTSQ